MTTYLEAQRDEMARDIFFADNANAPKGRIQEDWEALGRSTQAGKTYAYAIADGLIVNGYRKPRVITTVGNMAGLSDGTVFRTASGGVFEVRDGHMVRTDSKTWWSPLADWLPATVLWEPEA